MGVFFPDEFVGLNEQYGEDWFLEAISSPTRTVQERLRLKRLKDLGLTYQQIFDTNLAIKRAERLCQTQKS